MKGKIQIRWIAMVGSLLQNSNPFRPMLFGTCFSSKAAADRFRAKVARRESFLGFVDDKYSDDEISRKLGNGKKMISVSWSESLKRFVTIPESGERG